MTHIAENKNTENIGALQVQSDENGKIIREHYEGIRMELRLGYKELGRIVGLSDTTVRTVLTNDYPHHFYSEASKLKVYAALDAALAQRLDNLNRLSGNVMN